MIWRLGLPLLSQNVIINKPLKINNGTIYGFVINNVIMVVMELNISEVKNG